MLSLHQLFQPQLPIGLEGVRRITVNHRKTTFKNQSYREIKLVSGLPGALYSILFFAVGQSLLSNFKQSPYWILFHPLRIDTPIFQTKN